MVKKRATGQLTIYDQNDQRQLILYLEPSQNKNIVFDGLSTYSPNYATNNQILTPRLSVAGGGADVKAGITATRWFYQTISADGVYGAKTEITVSGTPTGHTLGATQPKTMTVSTNIASAGLGQRYICEVDYTDPVTTLAITMTTDIDCVKVTAGVNARIGLLTNESHGIPCNQDGGVITYTGAVATFSIMNGATNETGNWTITQTRSTGVVVTEAISSATATITAVTQDVSTVTFTATRSGFATITKVFTVSKIKYGTDSRVYGITLSAKTLNKSETNVYSPGSVTIFAESIKGTAAPVAYQGRYKVYEATEAAPTTYTEITAGIGTIKTADQTVAWTYTPTTNAASIKIELYQAGALTTLLDTETVAIVKDGFDAAYMQVWTEGGNNIKNGVGSVSIKADLYKGGTPVTPTAYAWYYLNDSSVWTLLNSTTPLGTTGYTSATLVVPASFIEGVENFKCVATYNSLTYSGVETIRVIDDPIECFISGNNVVRNSANDLPVKALVLQEGIDVDPGGTLYQYNWTILNISNFAVLKTYTEKTKSLTVNKDDFTGTAVLQCLAIEK